MSPRSIKPLVNRRGRKHSWFQFTHLYTYMYIFHFYYIHENMISYKCPPPLPPKKTVRQFTVSFYLPHSKLIGGWSPLRYISYCHPFGNQSHWNTWFMFVDSWNFSIPTPAAYYRPLIDFSFIPNSESLHMLPLDFPMIRGLIFWRYRKFIEVGSREACHINNLCVTIYMTFCKSFNYLMHLLDEIVLLYFYLFYYIYIYYIIYNLNNWKRII